MTDRVKTLTVVLDREMRDDDVECVVDAIKMVKCVRTVELGHICDSNTYMAYSDAVRHVETALNKALRKLAP